MLSSFADLGVPADLAALLARQGITEPFPIQAATLPDALAGRDVCGRAPTGSGKTLAFGIAAVNTVAAGPKSKARRPHGLVLVPTRELAAQVCEVIEPLAATRNLTVAPVYGGTGYGPQLRSLRSGVDLLVACPGRLEDLIERGDVSLGDVSLVVVDEADRMADMGFLPAVRRLLDATTPGRQVLLFSATLDGEVDVLIRRYQSDPARHEIVEPATAVGDVSHHFWKVDRNDRVQVATQVVAGHETAVVFCRTRHGADRLSRQLSSAGVEAVALHGSRTQAQRDRALRDFHNGTARALVATDVAARGIHVENVACVLHFDPPADHKDYVHRSGRTGRAGLSGTVVSLVTADQAAAVKSLQRSLGYAQTLERPAPPAPVARRSASKTRRHDPPAMTRHAVRDPHGARPAAPRTSPGRGERPASSRDAAARSERRQRPERPGRREDSPGRERRETVQRAAAVGRPARPSAGTVKWYDPVRGFGFIAPDGGGRDVFVHHTALSGRVESLADGDRVEFVPRPSPKGVEALELRAC